MSKWEEFIQLSNLSGTYFDKYDCQRVPTNGIDVMEQYKQYQGYWIGFGTYNDQKKKQIHQHSSSFTSNLQGVVVTKGR